MDSFIRDKVLWHSQPAKITFTKMKQKRLAAEWDMSMIVLRTIISLPFIWAVLIPLLFLDVVVEIYHQVGFRLYKIPMVERNKYIYFERQKLKKLSPLSMLGCVYCEYANGWAAYTQEIAARTEKYWCGIKHRVDDCKVIRAYEKDYVDYKDYE